MLSDTELRKQYDAHGKEGAVPNKGFGTLPASRRSDTARGPRRVLQHHLRRRGVRGLVRLAAAAPAHCARSLHRIGEISLMKDLTKTMEISMREDNEAQAEDAEAADRADRSDFPDRSDRADHADRPEPKDPAPKDPAPKDEPRPPVSGMNTPRGIPTRPLLMDKSEEDARLEAAGVTEAEKELRAREKKKGGLTKEQREELAAFERERKRVRDGRVDTLARKLVDRISIWTETDRSSDVTRAFRAKNQLEIENLKMESFGIEILHAIGATYIQKATSFLKSQKFLGISGFFSRVRDKGTLVKETWGTMSAAIDAQMTMEEMAKAEEKGGDDWTDERRAEFEKRVTGKILAAAWRGSKWEIQGVLRDVCDRVLLDKRVKLEKRIERAEALVMLGDVFQKVCALRCGSCGPADRQAERDPEDEGGFMAFEQLMAEAAAKKEHKDKDKPKTKDTEKDKAKAKAQDTDKDKGRKARA